METYRFGSNFSYNFRHQPAPWNSTEHTLDYFSKMATAPQQFCVRWNSYQTNLQNAFPKLLTSEHFVDVTLACENEMLKCHKVVLSACSTYFEKLLLDNPCQHPIIFMKDMKWVFGWICLHFSLNLNCCQIYRNAVACGFHVQGEVNVTQDDLPSLLKSAEALQIRGLCGSDQLLDPAYFNNIKQQDVQSPQRLSTPQPNTSVRTSSYSISTFISDLSIITM